jgi:hypothetical protein
VTVVKVLGITSRDILPRETYIIPAPVVPHDGKSLANVKGKKKEEITFVNHGERDAYGGRT